MANKIKGITIEIAGETTKLQSALKDVNKQSKNITSELKQVEKGLKFNPKNTELLAQKQKLLGDQVATTREKLDKLKDAEKQVQQQFERGEIKEEQYRAFQREVVETESKLKHYESQLKEVTKQQNTFAKALQDAGKKMQDVGKKMQDVGKNLSMKVTAPLMGVAAAAGKLGMDFEAAMSEVGAISGATGRDLEALEAKAKEMGATTKFSASQSAEGLKYMAMAGWDTQKMLEGLPGVLSLAAASGEELGIVSDIVTDAMTAFGMEASRATEFADILAAASSKSNTNISMLGESFKYVAPLAGALGYESKDAAIALGLMANAGIKGSQSGTAMRSILTRLAKPTKESGTAMEMLGLSITDADGSMKSLAEIMEDLRVAFKDLDPEQQAVFAAQIAGQEAMSGLLAIVNAGEKDFNTLSESINNSTGAAEGMSSEMQDNLQGRLTILKSSIEGVALQLYDALQPAFEKIVKVVQKVVNWFSELSPQTKTLIVTIGGIAAAIGPVLLVLGMLISSVGSIVALFGTLSASITAAGGALAILTGPIGIAVAAVAALTAGGLALNSYLKQSSIEVDLWGNEVSEKTQEAVGGFLKLNDEATVALDQLAWSGQAVSEEMANSIIATFDEMGNQVLANMQEDHTQQLSEMQSFFAQSAALTDEEEAEILAGMKEHQQQEQQRVKDNQARIQEILNRAKEEKRAITEEERNIIGKIQKEMTEQAVEYMSESEREQKVIMERLKSEASKISAEQAAEVVKNSKEQKEQVVSEAEQQYNETLAQIIKQRDEAGTITAEQADKLIEEATRQKEETILNAEEMHNRIIEEAQAQAEEHVNQVDWETGEILSKWDIFRNRVSETWDNIKQKASETWDSMKAKISEAWGSIKKTTKETWESVGDTIKGAVNGIIGFINKFIKAWNKIKLKVPSVNIPLVGKVGGFSIGLPNIKEIPRLAEGGIITQQTLAMLAESNKPEAVMPLDKIDGIIAKALEKAGGGGDTNIYVNNPQPSPAELARQIKRQQQELAMGF